MKKHIVNIVDLTMKDRGMYIRGNNARFGYQDISLLSRLDRIDFLNSLEVVDLVGLHIIYKLRTED